MGGETLTTIVSIFLAAILIGIFPMIAIADRNDDISQLTVQTYTSELVDKAVKTGKITEEDFNSFVQAIYSTGNTYDIDVEIQVLDENPSKKTTQYTETKIGENVYYSIFTTQFMNELETNSAYILKEGDRIIVKVSNTNTTIAQSLKNFFYSLAGNNSYSIVVTDSGTIAVNGG